MKKVYKIITAESEDVTIIPAEEIIEEEVNAFLSSGWELQGGVSGMYDTRLYTYRLFQALVKEVEE